MKIDSSETRFRLIAYVLDNNDVQSVNAMGSTVFKAIWDTMPVGARHAIVETEDGRYAVLDLREVIFGGKLDVYLHRWMTQPSEDAAKMAAQIWADPPMSLIGGRVGWMKNLTKRARSSDASTPCSNSCSPSSSSSLSSRSKLWQLLKATWTRRWSTRS